MNRDTTGLLWLMEEIEKENNHPESNALANPKWRAYSRLSLCGGDVSIEKAKEYLKEEEYWQKHPENYKGFRWC